MNYYKLNLDHSVEKLQEGTYPLIGDLSSAHKHVGDDTVNDQRVSTVFLHFDHDLLNEYEQPILFETMIFGGAYDQYQRRYSTYAEAQTAHHQIVKALHMGIDPDNYLDNPENQSL